VTSTARNRQRLNRAPGVATGDARKGKICDLSDPAVSADEGEGAGLPALFGLVGSRGFVSVPHQYREYRDGRTGSGARWRPTSAASFRIGPKPIVAMGSRPPASNEAPLR